MSITTKTIPVSQLRATHSVHAVGSDIAKKDGRNGSFGPNVWVEECGSQGVPGACGQLYK
ncbi:hypothetical protein PI126_g4697 [Phytophthora idaei]|nr:hypothetical protein PI126_g4697 [Phytophthora idaei]